ncbi:LysE family translocator [Pseudogulbenkiania subflava]|uniref:Resistance to homoserine/threonine (RhtB) family protein n=1 Tax=Pseudogulbenkiania subflava DSM 22618 TaxID=1123014 RepID=A0A1Y6BVX9_9NEIS|nr:LysE family translocator [Pseudogulbenkiania subflava]SMF31525.1 resistance to homoserine/threonine (RhtB) family protein [Pseudogulbenkiania subflava DSM 22618]
MSELISLSGIVIALAIGAASPGPSFLMVARTAVSHGRKAGLAAACGMGLGAFVFASAALLGLSAALTAVPWLYVAFKISGGMYLLYIASKIWRSAKEPLQDVDAETVNEQSNLHKQFAQGLATQVSNPKTAIVYGSVFAAFLPSTPTLHFNAAVLISVVLIEAGWYAIVAALLSAPQSRRTYLRYKKWVDRSAGAIMGALGIRLATTATVQ